MAASVPIVIASDQAASFANNTDGRAASTVGLVTTSFGYLFNETGWDLARANKAHVDGNDSTGYAAAVNWLFNGSTYDRTRTPKVFKTATATAAGDTAVWTPASTKKFRLMGYAIYLTANASLAAGGLEEILLRDSTTATGLALSAFVPGAAGTAFTQDVESGVVTLGNGLLSATANNVLNVNLGTALATGEVRVVVWGTEE